MDHVFKIILILSIFIKLFFSKNNIYLFKLINYKDDKDYSLNICPSLAILKPCSRTHFETRLSGSNIGFV